jgi:DNA polymerase-1
MKKLLLVDGHNLLFKAFYGIPERLLSNGRPIHGVIGFISILTKIIDSTEPTHVLVVFDPEEQPSRTTRYSPYKQNRHDYGGKPDRENPFSQLAYIKRALDSLLVKWVEQPGCEADDMIASYASQVPCKTIIAATDTDFLQLVCKKTTVLHYHRKSPILFTESTVREKYGIHPRSFLEYKSLIGDKTDNISGIRGIGPKTAIKVLKGERELTEEERKIFERNRGLIKLDTRIKLPYSLKELRFRNSLEGLKIGEYLRSIGVF